MLISQPRRWAIPALCCLLLLAGAHSQAPNRVLALGTIAGGFQIVTEGQAILDTIFGGFIIRNAVLDPALPVPLGLIATADPPGVTVRVSGPFVISLSPDGRTITIVLNPAAPQPHGTPLIVRLDHSDPQVVGSLVLAFFPAVIAQIDPRLRAVILQAPPETLPPVLAFIDQLDVPLAQVLLDAQVLEVSENLSRSLGLTLFNGPGLNIGISLNEQNPAGLLDLQGVTRTALTLQVNLQTLQTSGQARVLARPRIVTRDGVSASISTVENNPIIFQSENQVNVTNTQTGITLNITPRITSDGFIDTELSTSVSSVTGVTSQGALRTNTRIATTRVRVQAGHTIVIGGLLEEREVLSSSGIPFLADVPVLGALLGSQRTELTRTELFIFITPFLIGDGAAAPQPPAPPGRFVK